MSRSSARLSTNKFSLLSRKEHRFATIHIEPVEVSPGAERHGGSQILQGSVASDWRRRLLRPQTHSFPCAQRTSGRDTARTRIATQKIRVTGNYTRPLGSIIPVLPLSMISARILRSSHHTHAPAQVDIIHTCGHSRLRSPPCPPCQPDGATSAEPLRHGGAHPPTSPPHPNHTARPAPQANSRHSLRPGKTEGKAPRQSAALLPWRRLAP